ncbi:ketopantoate reductase family protein [Deinococcus apachensis]|uniref:ketopantoate reductase family protein n=1 Tax=Deinococcus apachensis TaxID=309886 RepID=UPI00037F47BB|nr:2-dehydropantoate 2-reductase [Deinococcus apachensis]
MRLLVWGAGAIGGTIGAHLVREGHDVTFVDRAAEHVAAMNRSGLRIEGPITEFTVPATAATPESLSGQWDRVLLCTKAQDTEGAALALAPHLAPDGCVVSVQNGLNPLTLAEHFGPGRVLGSFVNFGADYLSPGVIHYGGRGAVVLGELDGRASERAQELYAAFRQFEPNAVLTPNILGYLWSKLAYGAQLFATALTNDGIADALAWPEYRPLYSEIAREVLRVATAGGIKLESFNGFDPTAFLPGASEETSQRSLDDMVTFNRKSAKTHSGIWRDLAVRKRRTEADAQLGPIVAFGEKWGVPTPLTARLIELVHDLEEGRRDFGTANLDELRAVMAVRV